MALNFSLHFNCTTKVAYVKDDSVYTLPSSVYKYTTGSLIAPSGLAVFSKTNWEEPLIGPLADPRVSDNYSLGGVIPAGNYTYSISNNYEFNANIDTSNQFLKVVSSNVFYVLNVDLTQALSVGNSVIIGNCSNPDNDGTYTISAFEFLNGSTRFEVTQTTLTPTEGDYDATAIVQFFTTQVAVFNQVVTYSSCSKTLCLEPNFTYDAFSTQYGSATLADDTNYYGWTIDNRQLSLYYPAGLDPEPETNPITTATANINVNVLATGIYTCKLVVTASYIQNDGLVIDLTSTKIKQATVIAYTEMCGIQDCIQTMLDRHVAYLKSATVSPLQQYVDQVNGLYIMAKEALACGNRTSYSSYVSQIYDILGKTQDSCGDCSCGGTCDSCSDSCGCGQPDEPVWIDNLGIDVNSLLAEFENFMNNDLPTLQSTVDSLNTTVTDVNTPAIESLQTSVSAISAQTTTNTDSITQLQSEVSTLNDEVATLQEQIATFSPSNSEVASNELFTNDGSNKLLYTSSVGGPVDGEELYQYELNVGGNITSIVAVGDHITFYSPADKAWYQASIYSIAYKPTPNETQITVIVLVPTNWSINSTSFPVFLAKPSTGVYNFTKQFQLHNDNYWKIDGDPNFKYWAKLNTSFLWNSTSFGTELLKLYNNSTTQEIMIRDINPGTIVDLELTFEKVYNTGTSTYDLVYMLNVKYSSSSNKNVVDGLLLDNGFTGYAPQENSDLYQETTRSTNITMSLSSNSEGIYNNTQDVYSTVGTQNSNRLISKYAKGPSYPNSTSPQFFNGQGAEVITFNSLNCNMTILNFEVSYGKMPVA